MISFCSLIFLCENEGEKTNPDLDLTLTFCRLPRRDKLCLLRRLWWGTDIENSKILSFIYIVFVYTSNFGTIPQQNSKIIIISLSLSLSLIVVTIRNFMIYHPVLLFFLINLKEIFNTWYNLSMKIDICSCLWKLLEKICTVWPNVL